MIPQEIKEKIFASYYGNEFIITKGATPYKTGDVGEINDSTLCIIRGEQFISSRRAIYLKSISDILDEDVIEVGLINSKIKETKFDILNIERWIHNTKMLYLETSMSLPQNISDFLRNKGYALPYLNYSVEQLTEVGVFKIKQV